MIKVVGLGNKDGDISILGAVAIDNADVVIVKTALTDTYKYFEAEGITPITLDHLYEESEDFDDLDNKIVEFVKGYEKRNTVFCVNGSGTDDRSVLALSKVSNIEIIAGVSSESRMLVYSPTSAFCRVSSYDIAGDKTFTYDKTKTLIITDIDNEFVAGEVKEVLARLLGDEQVVTFYDNDGAEDMPIYEIDRLEKYDYSTAIMVEPVRLEEQQAYGFDDLMRIMYRLRGRNGCEWDKAQTHESIRKNLVEEAYELVEAIENEDIENIIEESGDVILQGVFHAVIGEDEGEFEAHEVLTHLCHKLVTRHRHIFGDVKANNASEALSVWEQAKADEKSHKNLSDKIDGVAGALPGLMKAGKVQKYAGKYGLEFDNIDQVVAKVREELDEVLNANDEDRELECGDLLFAVVNLLRKLDIDGEIAIGRATEKFAKRVKYVESECEKAGVDMKSAGAEYLDKLWNEAKANENR